MGNSWVVDNEQEGELTHLILIQVICKKPHWTEFTSGMNRNTFIEHNAVTKQLIFFSVVSRVDCAQRTFTVLLFRGLTLIHTNLYFYLSWYPLAMEHLLYFSLLVLITYQTI